MKLQMQREAPPRAAEGKTWPTATLIAFRFVFSFFLLYIFPGAVGSLGAYHKIDDPYRQLWHAVVPWVGINVLHLQGNLSEVANGSGDQLYDFVLLGCLAVLAVVATIIWSWVDRKRKNYDQLYEWLRVFVRLTLAVAMLTYGADKLFRMQFPPPPVWRFFDYYGNSAPMGLLWTFMGMSHAYSFFGGVGEMLGGLLLIVPRFATLGGLVTFGVMSNVLMLNFCYDVPRKIYSVALVLMSLFVILPDVRAMLNFFILGRKAEPAKSTPLLQDPQLNRWAIYFQYGIGIVALVFCLYTAQVLAVKIGTPMESPLNGAWGVNEFTFDGVALPPLVTDRDRWLRVIFGSAPSEHEDDPDEFRYQSMDSSIRLYGLHFDGTGKGFTLVKGKDPGVRGSFTYEFSGPDKVTLEGRLDGHQITASLARLDVSQFLLLKRGVHIINQNPLKR